MLELLHSHYNYGISIVIMMTGLYMILASQNMLKKLIGLSIFQTAISLFYISAGKVEGGTAPILVEGAEQTFSNPLPHVLILTAIVVGVATLAVGLALVVRIKAAYGTIEEQEAHAKDKVNR